MDRDTLDSLDKETLIRLILSQAEAIERLTREVEALRARLAGCHKGLSIIERSRSVCFRFESTPVIENSEPNFRRGWEADIRSSRLNDANANAIHQTFFCGKKGPRPGLMIQ
jgi:hypothetical protein